jgi:hypothetical protein
MRDILERLERALPAVEDWMNDLHERSKPRAVVASQVGAARLAEYYPATLLSGSYAVPVDVCPFPPVAAVGLPEFEPVARMAMAGITFGHMYFVAQGHWQDSLHFHELVHVVQWGTLGVRPFLRSYALGILRAGYDESPFEMAAYGLQAQFDAGTAIPGLVGAIEAHARQEHGRTQAVYRSCGMHERA